jgi:hypothetical protein
LPHATNPPEKVAHKIYQILVRNNYLPVEVQFIHTFHNPINTKYPWIDTTVRGNTPSIEKLYSLINNSEWFIGVASGPLVMALAIDHTKVIYLKNKLELSAYTDKKVKTVDVNSFDPLLFEQYIN